MMSNELVAHLLGLPKKIILETELLNELQITADFPFVQKYMLQSPDDKDYLFIYDIKQSNKNIFKVSFHVMDEESKIGLLRVDFPGKHKNPETITGSVPSFLHPFAGQYFDYNVPLIHYYVDGTKTGLEWALPIESADFPVKKVSSQSDIISAFLAVNNLINLHTNCIIKQTLL